MKNKKQIIPLLMSILVATGCSNDSEGDLTVQDGGDTKDPITFTGNIRSVLTAQCTGCHADPPSGAPFPLVTYEQVKQRVDNGSLLSAISKPSGQSGAMPPSGRMSQAAIDLIAQWIEEGAIEK